MEWQIEKAPPWIVAGCMSGTSLDGVDVAILETDGHDVRRFGASFYRPYSLAERDALRAALGRWEGAEVLRATAIVEHAHIEALQELRRLEAFDLIGFHGQTLAHDPPGRGTFQAGSGEVLARALRLPVVWDFRSDDVAAGGQGAPLAPIFHHALARYLRAQEPVAVLNLGGVGNVTFVDPTLRDPVSEGAVLAFDTGPANAPINDLMQIRRAVSCDRDGWLAGSGRSDEAVLAKLLEHPYFGERPPKSLDRDAFSHAVAAVEGLSDADAAATLTALAVGAVGLGLSFAPAPVSEIWVTGGGRKNTALMAGLDVLGPAVLSAEEAGFDGDMLEAQAFAYLAARSVSGLPLSLPDTTGVGLPTTGGRLSQS